MASVSDWKVPSSVQPKPEDYAYDLDLALACVVALRATVPADAFTAETLGTERAGNGVIIRSNGLVLTIGYLITEADSIWLTLNDGRSVPGHVLGYDQETGFGLVQALAKLDTPALEFGQSSLPAPAGVIIRSLRESPPNRSSPATGSTCSTKRSSRRRRIPTGAARR
jgi:S1-C subfamily serine protease